ncbi:hypothetical protein NE562_05530 [Butyricicoccus faecihominis]|uniref:hypothetical protein n=1 Tax=Butyricicoccus faecihominis TaxID=1712515 RepID=UPI00247AB3AB|nr:hypothetical protein [Butyricicoccus faecihominis]MCQ5129113.1 hypothetical protein [Butyricicoccus faecihominis]
MFDEKKFIEKVRAVDLGAYWPNIERQRALMNAAGADTYGLMLDAMRLGFLKGQRAEHKKHIKPRPKAYKNDTECMVHLLHARVDRMKDDETFIRKLHYYAKALENGPGWSGEGRKEAAQK